MTGDRTGAAMKEKLLTLAPALVFTPVDGAAFKCEIPGQAYYLRAQPEASRSGAIWTIDLMERDVWGPGDDDKIESFWANCSPMFAEAAVKKMIDLAYASREVSHG